MEAVEKFRCDTGSYPRELQELKPYLLGAQTATDQHDRIWLANGWGYEPPVYEPGYTLSRRLGWDPTLYFNSETREWVFDPGDGDSEKIIKLDVELPAPRVPAGSAGGSSASPAPTEPKP